MNHISSDNCLLKMKAVITRQVHPPNYLRKKIIRRIKNWMTGKQTTSEATAKDIIYRWISGAGCRWNRLILKIWMIFSTSSKIIQKIIRPVVISLRRMGMCFSIQINVAIGVHIKNHKNWNLNHLQLKSIIQAVPPLQLSSLARRTP